MATSHLNDLISTTTNLDEACPLDTSCDHLLHLDSPSLSSELQDNSSVDSVDIELLPESEGQLDHTNLSTTDVFSGHHDYELFLILLQKKLDAPSKISTIRTFIAVKIKMASSSMPPTLAIPLHYPNSWHNTMVKTRIPLMLQVQYQPLSKPQVIIPSNLSVLITQWKPCAINPSTPPS